MEGTQGRFRIASTAVAGLPSTPIHPLVSGEASIRRRVHSEELPRVSEPLVRMSAV